MHGVLRQTPFIFFLELPLSIGKKSFRSWWQCGHLCVRGLSARDRLR